MATSMITMELLGRGTHADPRHGCNVLELASVLAGEPWSTQPHSVHPALAAVAGTVNDLLSDDRRRLLAPIAPWLPGTNTADPRVWPAIVNVCTRAAAPVGGPGQPQLPAAPDEMSSQPAEGNSPGCGRRRRPWPGPRHRRWAKAAIGSALRSLAGSADQCDTDAALCQVLVDCINECRWLAGKEAVDPRLPLADCPRRLAVQPRLMWSPGCDWMELGYRPVLYPVPVPAYPAQAPGQATNSRPRRSPGKRAAMASGVRSAGNRRGMLLPPLQYPPRLASVHRERHRCVQPVRGGAAHCR
jgi:hypothetical protein